MSVQRIVSAAVMAPLVVGALLWLQTPYVAAIAAALFLFGLWEWSRLVGIDEPLRRAFYVTANIGVMASLSWGGRPLFGAIALAGVIWWLFAMLWLARPTLGSSGSGWSRSLKLAAGTLSIIPAWCALYLLHVGNGDAGHADTNGPRWALLCLAMIWAADSGAYFVGKRFGRRKLIPHISPGKTWAGLWGGLFAGVALALAGAQLVGVGTAKLPQMAALALLTISASVVGDLFESLMKRQAGFKDSGNVIPGHGGVLDRIDSLLAALPVLWIAKGWLEL